MRNSNINQLNIPQARETGSVSGQMVKKLSPVRSARFERLNRIAPGHVQTVEYIATITA